MIESNSLTLQLVAVCAFLFALFNIFNSTTRIGLKFSQNPILFSLTQGILIGWGISVLVGAKMNVLNVETLKYLLIASLFSAIGVYALSYFRLSAMGAPFPPSVQTKDLIAVTLFFCFVVCFGFSIHWITVNRDLGISKMETSPLDTLADLAGTGKLVHIEGIAAGEPKLTSISAKELAFQKLRITPLPKGPLLFDGYSPSQFCVTDGKGSIYIKSSDIVEFQDRLLANEQNNNRADIATPLLDDFDRYKRKPGNNAFAQVWTIKKGAHISAAGEVEQDKEHNCYVLKAPTFWHAPLLGHQLWLQVADGIKTL